MSITTMRTMRDLVGELAKSVMVLGCASRSAMNKRRNITACAH